jgi:hypothetical protein
MTPDSGQWSPMDSRPISGAAIAIWRLTGQRGNILTEEPLPVILYSSLGNLAGLHFGFSQSKASIE